MRKLSIKMCKEIIELQCKEIARYIYVESLANESEETINNSVKELTDYAVSELKHQVEEMKGITRKEINAWMTAEIISNLRNLR